MADLTHLDDRGQARMVDVAGKDRTVREAVAAGIVRMRPETLALIREGALAKGDVLAVARVAGIQAAKRTPELVPLCHPVALTSVSVELDLEAAPDALAIRAVARAADRTGVEMEALTAVVGAALCVYDMVKAVDRGVVIGEIRLLEKSGGRSGRWVRDRT